ncbi:DUF2330 domain-containing protein [Mycobacterium barrassiae]|uniref:DUF2330 domain-containing protein n=1 Tax=Mycobacterium barrassiae TaxID=319709 RepID=UPI002265CBE4|nr:DUF2330 domain-containing protein [Mycobacterium barrassiae]
MVARACQSIALVLAVLTGAVLFSIASPAWACGCGAYVPDNPGSTIADERALIAWDGTTEDILMSLSVMGSSDRAAWVMPVPSAADVTLGDTAVFEELGKLTAPRIEYRDSWWPTLPWLVWAGAEPETAGAPGGAVNVLGRQRLGPFDVTRLAANDPTALANWLRDNGFPHPDGLDENLAPYVEDGWEIIAVQLIPAEADGSLSGPLQPLRMSFASDTVVYPMRLSRSATVSQYIDLYVLADHRMDPTAVPVAADKPTLEFAGRLEPGDSPALADYVGDGAFLTRWKNTILDPSAIEGDYVFEQAASDTPFQQVIYRTRDRGEVTARILLAALASAGIVAIVVLLRLLPKKPSRR